MKKILIPISLLLLLLGAQDTGATQKKPAKTASEGKEKVVKEKTKKVKAERDTILYPDSYLDTVDVSRKLPLNDYTMIGFEYGVSRNSQMFTPAFRSKPVFFPDYFGVTFTRYGKLIGSPFVGFQAGAFYGHEGYEFKINEETGSVFQLEGATKVVMKYAEGFVAAVGHYDMSHFKILANIGPYAGYRLSIHRTGPFPIAEELVDGWTSYDRRFDYGLHGGVGFAIVFEPVEFQVNLRVRYSWSSLWEPNFNSEYYYRYAYPFDFMLTGGLHFHLTRRYGKTKAVLRKEAHDIIYNTQDNE